MDNVFDFGVFWATNDLGGKNQQERTYFLWGNFVLAIGLVDERGHGVNSVFNLACKLVYNVERNSLWNTVR